MSDQLQLRYALFERMPNGYQWTWYAEGLKKSLLYDFFYRIQMPDDASTNLPEHIQGGILKFAHVHESKVDEHVVLYRFYNGGRDERGRPRVTMLTAWATTDQLPAPQAANGILELFRSPMFKSILDKAKTIGIERPYSLIVDEPLPATLVSPSVPLADFLRGSADENHHYSFTIQKDNLVLEKKSSAAFKYREAEAANRKREDEQHNKDQMKREAEEKKRLADERKRKADEQKREQARLAKEKRRQGRKGWMILIVTLIAIPSSIVIVYVKWDGSWNPPVLSPAAQNVVDRFKKLPLQDQQHVLVKLQSIVDERTQGPSPTAR